MENAKKRIRYIGLMLQSMGEELGGIEARLADSPMPQLSSSLVAEMESFYRGYINDVDLPPPPNAIVQAFISKIRELFGKLVAANEEIASLKQFNRDWDKTNLHLHEKIKKLELDRQNLLSTLTAKEKREGDLLRELSDTRDWLKREERLRKEEREASLAERQRLAEENDKLRSAYLPTANEMDYRAWLREILAADVDRPTQGMHYSGAVTIFIERYKKLRQFAAWAKTMFIQAQHEGVTNIETGLAKLEGFNFDKG